MCCAPAWCACISICDGNARSRTRTTMRQLWFPYLTRANLSLRAACPAHVISSTLAGPWTGQLSLPARPLIPGGAWDLEGAIVAALARLQSNLRCSWTQVTTYSPSTEHHDMLLVDWR